MVEFEKGHRLRVVGGGELEIVKELGRGGQGIVYLVTFGGKEYALKWYINFPQDLDAFYENIKHNVEEGSPSDKFLWPLEITEKQEGSFGYLMGLRPQNYRDVSDFLLHKCWFKNISCAIRAALEMVSAFRIIHQKGYSYQDLNPGNFFIDPDTGAVLICDNDNVSQYGRYSGIAGRQRFMAPEIVRGEKKPDIHTDYFSLAVNLFFILFYSHPLEGANYYKNSCITPPIEKRLYGTNPVFVCDPIDKSNSPVRGGTDNLIKLWPAYPELLRSTFVDAFSKESMTGGKTTQRVDDKKWQATFVAIRDMIVECNKCSHAVFYNNGQTTFKCSKCGNAYKNINVLNVAKHSIVLYPKKKLCAGHVNVNSDDFETEVGSVMIHPATGVLGLKNTSQNIWLVGGKQVSNGMVVPLQQGLQIDFGKGVIGTVS